MRETNARRTGASLGPTDNVPLLHVQEHFASDIDKQLNVRLPLAREGKTQADTRECCQKPEKWTLHLALLYLTESNRPSHSSQGFL
jgi:hypothetical protein